MIVLVIAWQAKIRVQPMSYASIQSEVISVSLDSPNPVESKSQKKITENVPTIEPIEKPAEEQKSKATVEKKSQPEITDLFSSVKVTQPPKEIKRSSKEITELSALDEKVLSTKRSSQLSQKVQSLDLAKSGVKVLAASSGPLVNEYYAKVQGIIYANFHPASGTEGFSARVRIVLSPDGKLVSYRVVSSSGSAVFNAEVDWLKERLRQVVLPSHPNGSEATFDIILTAKD
jgi:protein TonB